MATWDELANDATLKRVVAALSGNGIDAEIADNGAGARKRVLDLLPHGAEVFTMTSRTLETVGLKKEIEETGHYLSVRRLLSDPSVITSDKEKRRLGAAPDWALGSVHAVTENGRVLVASMTGSQLPAYAYGAGHVIWVVGAQKVVATEDDAIRRINDYVLPLEDQRMRAAYGIGSAVNKLLTIYREANAGRLRVILVKERLGF